MTNNRQVCHVQTWYINKPMKFESKKYGPMTRRGMIRILVFLIAINIAAYYYEGAPSERLLYFSMAILVLFAIMNLLFPARSVITIEENAVTFENNGMVTANFHLDDVEEVELGSEKCNRLLLVSTKDKLKFGIPASGYSDEDITKIVNALSRHTPRLQDHT